MKKILILVVLCLSGCSIASTDSMDLDKELIGFCIAIRDANNWEDACSLDKDSYTLKITNTLDNGEQAIFYRQSNEKTPGNHITALGDDNFKANMSIYINKELLDQNESNYSARTYNIYGNPQQENNMNISPSLEDEVPTYLGDSIGGLSAYDNDSSVEASLNYIYPATQIDILVYNLDHQLIEEYINFDQKNFTIQKDHYYVIAEHRKDGIYRHVGDTNPNSIETFYYYTGDNIVLEENQIQIDKVLLK